ncbi:MAG: hypothetical protein JWO05_1808 [Gemmatimonadetes bacterium]|nr:hypothetical protein [Gemmatimonadota bacterium]
MTGLFLVAFVAGVLLGIKLMASDDPAPAHLAELAWFLALSGAVGYLATRDDAGVSAAALVLALVLGAVGALLARWITRRPAAADPAARWRGQVARVSRTIGAGELGEVELVLDGRPQHYPARTLDGSAVPIDARVIVQGFSDDGVAMVEAPLTQ